MELWDFLFHNVQIRTTRGENLKGFVRLYESAYDNDDTEDGISISDTPDSKSGIWLNRSEIENIQLLDETE